MCLCIISLRSLAPSSPRVKVSGHLTSFRTLQTARLSPFTWTCLSCSLSCTAALCVTEQSAGHTGVAPHCSSGIWTVPELAALFTSLFSVLLVCLHLFILCESEKRCGAEVSVSRVNLLRNDLTEHWGFLYRNRVVIVLGLTRSRNLGWKAITWIQHSANGCLNGMSLIPEAEIWKTGL